MKISQAESSNEVIIYDVADKNIKLIDTPGLFDFKEHNIGEAEAETYHDMTCKYVSEANMLFYVLEPSNPIKAGHEKVLKWLFRDLKILPRTLFILNQFDQVADPEDDENFNEEFSIKKKTVTERLDDILSLTEEEKSSLTICAVAANPFGKGSDYWEKNREEFNKLSHLSLLQDYEKDIQKAKKALSTQITEYLTDLIRQVGSLTDQKEYKEFFETEIGENGILVRQEINKRYSERFTEIQAVIEEKNITYQEAGFWDGLVDLASDHTGKLGVMAVPLIEALEVAALTAAKAMPIITLATAALEEGFKLYKNSAFNEKKPLSKKCFLR